MSMVNLLPVRCNIDILDIEMKPREKILAFENSLHQQYLTELTG